MTEIHGFRLRQKQAKALGLDYFLPWKPCRNGHTGYRRSSHGVCLECLFMDRPKLMVRRKKAQCKQQGIDFNLTVDDIDIPERCPVLGIPIKHDTGNREQTPSIDRIDPSGGYVRGNVRVISARANRLKSDATKDELLAIANSM